MDSSSPREGGGSARGLQPANHAWGSHAHLSDRHGQALYDLNGHEMAATVHGIVAVSGEVEMMDECVEDLSPTSSSRAQAITNARQELRLSDAQAQASY